MNPTPGEVYQALRDSISAGSRIDLVGAAQRPALAGLGRALTVLRITGRYELGGVALAQDPDAVTLTGDGSFGLPGAAPDHIANVRAEVTYTISDGPARFVLTLAMTGPNWTFGSMFASLPDCEAADEDGVVESVPSFLSALPLQAAALHATAADGQPAGLRLTGDLPAATVLAPYADFFKPWPLLLDGTVVLPATAAGVPELDLVARSARSDLTAGPIRLGQFGLELISTAGTDEEGFIPLTVLNAVAELRLGSDPPVTGAAFTQLLVASDVWRLFVQFGADGPTLGDGFAGVARAFGLDGAASFAAPAGVRALTGFRFDQLEVGIHSPAEAGVTGPEHVAATLVSDDTWVPPLPFLSVSGLGMRWLTAWGDKIVPEYLAGSFFGTVRISGPGDADDFALLLTAEFPAFTVSARLAEGDIALSALLAYFLGVPPPAADLRVSALSLDADLSARTFDAYGNLTSGLAFDLPGNVRLELTSVAAWIRAGQDSVTGGLRATLALPGAEPPGAPEPLFSLTAEYRDAAWEFAGGLTGNSVVDLTALVARFAGTQPPADFELLLEKLELSFAPGAGTYALAGTIATRWTPALLDGAAIAVAASAEIARAAGQQAAGAHLTGLFQVSGFAVAATVDLKAREVTYAFRVTFGDWSVSAEVDWADQGEDRHRVITIHIGAITLGELIEYLISLVAPTIGVRLEPPWDILGRIELSRFVLVVDPTLNTVEVTYRTDIALPMMTLKGIGLRARRERGKPAVELTLNRSPEQEPLSWDLLSDPPPEVPGLGSALVRLDYLGVGQRIRLRGEQPETLRAGIARLRSDLLPPDDPDANPLRQDSGAALQFAGDAGWLLGLDITVADAVQVALLLSDPQLYGLAIGLRGEKTGTLAGLRFEILYKKVSADAGVFRAELQLPDAIRRLQFGAVSLTLGVVVVEVFTNGDFRVDLGFPRDGDFARSFSVEVLPFLGRGGLYFGKLGAATSSRVPAISNGTFSPVIELGVGIAAGVGKEIRSGPLSGGAYVEVMAIFEGVFAWFNPLDAGPAEQYHWVSAFVAVHGKLYGQVDLSVLKLAVTVEAWAQASVVLESHRATEFQLSAQVVVNAELTIGFIRIPLSFSASVELSLTVGQDSPAPWLLSEQQGSTGQRRLRGNILPPLGRVPHRRLALLRTAMAGTDLDWDPQRRVFADSPRTTRLTLLPVLTLTDVPLAWSSTAPANPDPHYRAALMLMAPREDPANPGPPPAWQFIEALLRWSISAATRSPGNDGAAVVTAAQLREVADALAAPQPADGPMSIGKLAAFLRTNLRLEIAGGPTGELVPTQLDGSVLPMPPRLTITSPQAGEPRNLATFRPVGPYYLWGAAGYAASLSPAPPPAGLPPDDSTSAYFSYGTHLFCDWCLMAARTSVQAAAAAMTGWQVRPAAAASLADVARMFPTARVTYLVRAGDTLDSAAAALGTGPAELRFLNPDLERQLADAVAGAEIGVALGVAPEGVAIDNATVPLAPTAPLKLGTIDYQVEAGDTLASLIAKFSGRPPASLFPGGLADPLATDELLLRGDSRLAMPAVIYHGANPADPAARLLAAGLFFSHYQALAEVESSGWYAAAVFDLNADIITWGPGDEIPPGLELAVPCAFNDAAPDRALTYLAAPGDTIGSVARALALAQRFGTGEPGPAGWPQFRDSVVPAQDGLRIPEAELPVLPRETLAALADRLIVSSGNLTSLLGYVADAPILTPLAVVPVPAVTVTGTGHTLAELADYLGISIENLASRITEDPLFAAGTPLRVAHLPVQHTDKLVQAVLAGGTPAAICGQTSRNLLSGTRLPAPQQDQAGRTAATGPLVSLYDLTGQQLPGPVPDPQRPGEVGLEINVTTNNDAADWITLVGSLVASQTDTTESLAARLPDFAELNPGLAADPGRLRPGMIIRSGRPQALTFRYTNADLDARYPARSLAISPVAGQGPGALPRAGQLPRGYGLDHRIELQTPVPLPLPGPPEPAGTMTVDAPPPSGASAWPLPQALLAYAREHPATRFDVARASRRPDAPDEGDLVPWASFAPLFRLRVRRLPGRPHIYELSGADLASRNPLLELWIRLAAGDRRAQVFLAAAPAPDAGNPAGLAVLDADEAGTFLVRANLSTQTAPPGGGPALAAAGAPFADLSAPGDFLRLLWEGTVIGGAGYYLGFAASDGTDLPPGAFDETGAADLGLLVLIAHDQGPEPDGRLLPPYCTCVVAVAGLDPAATSLWVETADDSDVSLEPLVPQGSAGFGVTLTPPAAGAADPASRLRTLFSLVRYAAEAPFGLPDVGLPVQPLVHEGQPPGWQRARLARRHRAGRDVAGRPAAALWRYEQVLPLSRLGPPSPCPDVPGLPPRSADPYRGAGSAAEIRLGLSDVLGNITVIPDGTAGSARLPLGGTDPLIGLGAWPGLAAAYWVDRGPEGIRIRVGLTPQPASTMPPADGSGLESAQAAALAASRLASAYYQLAAGRATAAVLTTLRQEPSGAPLALPADAAALWRVCTAGYLAASAAASAEPALAGGTLAEINARYGATYARVAAANAARPAAGLLGADPAVPACHAILDGDSAETILARLGPGWPRPGSAADLLRRAENASLRLRPGAVLSTSETTVTVGSRPVTLVQVAAGAFTTPALLAADSADRAGVLETGFQFMFEGLTVPVPAATTTLRDIQQEFARQGVIADVADIAAASAERDGMLVPGSGPISRHYITQPGDTIASNDSRTDLAAANGGTPGIFPAGTVVTTGIFASSLTRPGADETLTAFAARFGCPPHLLLAANAVRPLDGAPVVIPGAVRIADPGAVRAPYAIGADDTLAAVAGLFGTDAVTLATANATMPATMAAGRTVTVILDGLRYEIVTASGDSFTAVHQQLAAKNPRIGFADAAAVFAQLPGYLAAGALLSCPVARLPGTGPVCPAEVALAFGLDPAALGLANAGLLGLVEPGVMLRERCGGSTIVTGPDDTLNSLAARFADARELAGEPDRAAGGTAGIAEIAEFNRDVPFLRGAALALLPPGPAAITVSFPEAGPFGAPACPLTVTLRLQRADDQVDPQLRTPGRDGSAERADTTVPAQVVVDGSCDTQTRTLAPFARAFHLALPELRLATARAGGSAAAGDAAADLWLVNFGPDGISQITVQPGARLPDGSTAPRCYAIRPLYREPVTLTRISLPALDEQGRLVEGAAADLRAADVETWGRRFLGDLDTALSAAYACGMYGDPIAQPALDLLLTFKARLAPAISASVAEVLALPVPATPGQLAAARQALADRLATELLPGYDTAALVQYEAAVVSPWTRGTGLAPARLLGTAEPVAAPAVPYQLTAAKTALEQSSGRVTFLLTLPEPQRHRAVGVDLEYGFTHLEHDIHVITGTGGYAASDWLTFYPPLRGSHRPAAVRTSLGTAAVPIPLRAYPAQPTLIGQAADPTVARDPDIGDAARWTFSLSYAHEHAAQDEVLVTATFNVPPARRAGATAGYDLAIALARYNAVADPLWALMAAYGGSGGDRSAAANAAVSFADLAEDITTCWLEHTQPAAIGPGPGAAAVRYTYGVSASDRTDPDGTAYLSSVRLRASQDPPGPGGEWPQVLCHAADGLVELVPAQPDGGSRDYAVPGPERVPRTAWLTLTLRWPGLRVTGYQNARASLSVRRNYRLLGQDQPPTTDGFLFRTAEVTAPAAVTPLLLRQQPIDITSLGGDLGAALGRALSELTGTAEGTYVTLGAWYGYDLVAAGPGDGLGTSVPVVLLPHHRVSPATGGMVRDRLDNWLNQAAPPAAASRRWVLSLVIHSDLPGTSAQPLLVIDRLTFATAPLHVPAS